MMKQYKCVISEVAEEYPVIQRAQLPDVIFNVLDIRFARPCSVFLQHSDVCQNLFAADTVIFACLSFCLQVYNEVLDGFVAALVFKNSTSNIL